MADRGTRQGNISGQNFDNLGRAAAFSGVIGHPSAQVFQTEQQ